jgi:FHS family glucose/mannose:H+ symporter-like MFS transporter
MTRVVVLASLSFATLALCLVLPGALLPLLVERFHMRLMEAGSLLALQPAGHLLSVAAAPRAIEKIGCRNTLRLAFMIPAFAYFAFGWAASWPVGAAIMFATGMGIGTIEVACNTLMITNGGPRSTSLLNLTHLFFGVGAVLVPMLTTQAVAAGASWTSICVVTACITAAVGMSWGSLPRDAVATDRSHAAGAKLQWRFLLLLAAGMAVYVGAEMGLGSWLTKYMMSRHGVALTTAGNVLSLYWLGLTAGRLALSFLAHRTSDERLLVGLTLFASAAVLVAVLSDSPLLSAIGFTATGLGFSGIFPGIIALGGRLHPHSAARATSALVAGAGIGQITLPWCMSLLADVAGLNTGMTMYALLCLLLAAIAVQIQRRTAHMRAAAA